MAELGKAYVEVRADLAKFPAELRTKLIAALKKALAGVDFSSLEEKASVAGENAAHEAADGFEREGKERFEEAGKESGRSMLKGLKSILSPGSSEGRGFFASIGGFFSGIAGAVGGALHAGGGGGGGGGDDGSAVAGALKAGFQEIAQLLEDVFASSIDLMGLLQSGFSSIFAGRGEQLTEFLGGQFERVKELWGRMREQGREVLGNLFNEDSRAWFGRLATRGRDLFRDLRDRGSTFFSDLATRSRPFFTNLMDRGRRFFRDLGTRDGTSFFGRMATRGRSFFGTLATQAASFASRFGTAVSDAVSRAAAAIGPALSSALGSVSSSLSSIGGGIGAILPIAGMAVIVPVLLLVAGAVVQLGAALFALPAALAVVVAAVAPFMIAMQGISEAVGAGLSGDTEKFNEALKGLAPSARSVVKELVGLGPAFKGLKANVQQAFFAPLIGAFAPLAKTLIPELNRGLTLVAGSLGKFVRGFVELLSANDIVEAIGDVFESTGRILERLGPSLAGVFATVIGVMEKGLPFVEKFFGGLADGADKAAGFLSRIQINGQLTTWLSKVGPILMSGLRIAKEFGGYLLRLLGGKVGDNGAGFLQDVADKLHEINDFMKTKQGTDFINNIATGAKAVGKILVFLMGALPIVITFINGMVEIVRYLGRALEAIGRGFVIGLIAIGAGFVWLYDKIKSGFSTAYSAVTGFFSSVGSAIGNFFTETVPGWLDAIGGFFSSLPGKIADGLTAFGETIKKAIVNVWLFVFHETFRQIGRVIGVILALPQLIEMGLNALPGLLAALWDGIWSYAVSVWEGGRDLVVGAVSAIPGLLAAAGSAIAGFFTGLWDSIVAGAMAVPGLLGDAASAIGTFFSDLWTGVVDSTTETVTNGYNGLVNFLSSIPGRIAALGPKVLEAARGIGHKIAEGLSSIGNFATDLGKKVTNALRSGINSIIGSINQGITDIDDKLPGTLPRIPKLARGAIVDRPTLALVGEAGREAVIPLSDPARARQLAQESGLVNLLQSGRPSAAVNVTVYLDPTGVIIPIARTVVDDALDEQGSEATYGTRAA